MNQREQINIFVVGSMPSVFTYEKGKTPQKIKEEYINAGAEIRRILSRTAFIKENFGEQIIPHPEIRLNHLINVINFDHALVESITADMIIVIDGWDICREAHLCLFLNQHGYEKRLIMLLTEVEVITALKKYDSKSESQFELKKFPYRYDLQISNDSNVDKFRMIKGTIDVSKILKGEGGIIDISKEIQRTIEEATKDGKNDKKDI